MLDRNTTNLFPRNFRQNITLSIETLIENIKPRALQIMSWNVDRKTIIIAFFGILVYLESSVTCAKIRDVQPSIDPSTENQLSIKILMQEFKPTVIEKYANMKLNTRICQKRKTFCNFCTIKILTEGTKKIIFLLNRPPEVESCLLNNWSKKSCW